MEKEIEKTDKRENPKVDLIIGMILVGMLLGAILLVGFEMNFGPVINREKTSINEDYVNNWVFFNVNRNSVSIVEEEVYVFLDYGDRIEKKKLFPVTPLKEKLISIDQFKLEEFPKEDTFLMGEGVYLNFPGVKSMVIVELNDDYTFDTIREIHMGGSETFYDPIEVVLNE
jgi:hypothetical protein